MLLKLHKDLLKSASLSGFDTYFLSKYKEYLYKVEHKQRLVNRNRTAMTDSQQKKVYTAEHTWWRMLFEQGFQKKCFDGLHDANDYLKKIVRSKTWEKLCAEFKGCHKPKLELLQNRKVNVRTLGLTSWGGVISLAPNGGLNEMILLHELAHACGNMHHDVGFRIAEVKLVSRFIGRKEGQLLRKCFRERKLKMTMPKATEAKSPEEWLTFYNRLQVARSSRQDKR